MIRHHPALVRMRFEDRTLHCDAHGLLDEAETLDVLRRFGAGMPWVIDASERGRRWPWRWLLQVVGIAERLFTRPKCEHVQ